MAKYHESGTICEATVRECPLGVAQSDHIEASSKTEFEAKLAERFDTVAAPAARELSTEEARALVNSEWESLAANLDAQLKADGIEYLGYFPDSKPVSSLGYSLSKLTAAKTKRDAKRHWEAESRAGGNAMYDALAEADELYEDAFGRKISASGTTLSYNLTTVLHNDYLVKEEEEETFSGLKYELAADSIREKMKAIGELRRIAEANDHKFNLLRSGGHPSGKALSLVNYYQIEGTAAQKALIEREKAELAKRLKGKDKLDSEYSEIHGAGILSIATMVLKSEG